jgi:hypothetical protein
MLILIFTNMYDAYVITPLDININSYYIFLYGYL